MRFVEERPQFRFGPLPRGQSAGQVFLFVSEHPGHFFLVRLLWVDIQFVEYGERGLKSRRVLIRNVFIVIFFFLYDPDDNDNNNNTRTATQNMLVSE